MEKRVKDRKLFFLVLSIGFMAKLQKAAFLQKPTKKLEIPYHQSRERDEKKN